MKKFTKMMLAIFAGAMTIASCSSNDDYTVEKEKNPQNALLGQASGETETVNGHECVDLGLSVKWATMNVGATEVAGTETNSHTGQPDCYGEYYAWGETSPKDSYDWSNFKYCTSYDAKNMKFTFSKYVDSSNYGIVDNKTTLEMSDDAARANWGGTWRMPTTAEQKELLNNCYWEWTSSYNDTGVKGYIVYKVQDAADKGKRKYSDSSTTTVGSYSLGDNHIFLPATGSRSGSGFCDEDTSGYWSSSMYSGYSFISYFLMSYSSFIDCGYGSSRFVGRSVRAVCQ